MDDTSSTCGVMAPSTLSECELREELCLETPLRSPVSSISDGERFWVPIEDSRWPSDDSVIRTSRSDTHLGWPVCGLSITASSEEHCASRSPGPFSSAKCCRFFFAWASYMAWSKRGVMTHVKRSFSTTAFFMDCSSTSVRSARPVFCARSTWPMRRPSRILPIELMCTMRRRRRRSNLSRQMQQGKIAMMRYATSMPIPSSS
mmetsp:Transcript_21616/g.66066  ORF Transcript_21616/g.66066 Transcript_21616/m.66066 type:complete len:203 (+) Transcript_21616:1787-2395(+)